MRATIAVSACLLGEPVRYDGRQKREARLREWLAGFRVLPVCPEIGIGLGVPRAPIQLYRIDGRIRLADCTDPTRDHSAAMRACARAWLACHPDLGGLVSKSRSPSCAVGDAPLFDARGEPLGREEAAGLFVAVLRELLPSLPLIDEHGLNDERRRTAFLDAVAGYR